MTTHIVGGHSFFHLDLRLTYAYALNSHGSFPMTSRAASSPALDHLRAALPQHLQGKLLSARQLLPKSGANSAIDSANLRLLSTTLSALDLLLAGGLPRGQMVELIGRRSSGRFSILLSTLAAATTMGEAAALVDLGHNLDPQAAAGAHVVLERLLWVRPDHLKQALISAEMLLRGGFPLVVLDLGNPPIAGGRGGEAFWLRLARAAAQQEAALLISSPYRVSGSGATIVVKAERARPVWHGRGRAPRLLNAFAAQLTLEKFHGRPGGQTATLNFTSADRLAPLAPMTPIDSIAPLASITPASPCNTEVLRSPPIHPRTKRHSTPLSIVRR